MSSKLKLSQKSTEQLDYLSSALSLRKNIVCRIALATSLRENSPPEIDLSDLSGLEFNKSTILGTDEMVFRALITQHYGKHISDDSFFNKYVRAEIISGLNILSDLYRKTNSPTIFINIICNNK